MRILLPPSQEKSVGGTGLPLYLSMLSFPELTPLRRRLIDLLVGLAADPAQARAALGTTPRQHEEIDRNRLLGTSPMAPARSRYTGVLYDALDIASLRAAAAEHARTRLLVWPALFGALRPDDPVPQAVSVRVLTEAADGSRSVVRHANKSTKGQIARAPVSSRALVEDLPSLLQVLRRAGFAVERDGPAAADVGLVLLIVEGTPRQQALADRRGVQRHGHPDARGHLQRLLTLELMGVDSGVTGAHPDVHGLPDRPMHPAQDLLHPDRGRVLHDGGRHRPGAWSDCVLTACVSDRRIQPDHLLQQPIGDRLGDSSAGGDLGERLRALCATELLQHAQQPLRRRVRRPLAGTPVAAVA